MDTIAILNTIRSNASATYQDRIPEATRNNIEDIRTAMIGDDNIIVANEFTSSLMNRLIKAYVHTKMFSNPLKSLKQGNKPLGDTIEEVYVNFIKGSAYDSTGADLLSRSLPDVKTVFHRMNYKQKYKVTVSREALAKAFASYNALDSYITNIISSLYNSAELDEFINTKQLIKSAIDHKAMKTVTVADPTLSDTNAKAFIKAVKTHSNLMTFPTSQYNAYTDVQSTDSVPITTFSRKNEQVLILDTATDTAVSVDVLASIFNMSVADFNETKKIVIDVFPDPNVRAALVDEKFFQIYDDMFTMASFRNGEGLYDNYYLHVWQTLAYSVLVNAIAFVIGSDQSDANTTVDDFNVTYTLKTGVTSSNKRTKVVEGGSYSTTLKGVAAGDTVAVTMGGSTVANAYDSTKKTVSIATVTGAIVITVS